jgi:hypothetical protein
MSSFLIPGRITLTGCRAIPYPAFPPAVFPHIKKTAELSVAGNFRNGKISFPLKTASDY